jgi:prevent-host-death family protein
VAVVEVPVSDLRANLRHYLDEVRDGAELIVTERGLPVARILGVDATPAFERLVKEGVIGLPESANRPRAEDFKPVRLLGDGPSASDIVIQMRGG